MDTTALSSHAGALLGVAAVAGAGLWHLIRPFAQPYIDKAIAAMPAYLAGKARDQFAYEVTTGKIPPAAARLFKAIGKATLQWAEGEVGAGDDAAQAAVIVAALARVPGLGKLVTADPDDAAHDIMGAIAALKAQLARDAAPTPAPAQPNPAAANPQP